MEAGVTLWLFAVAVGTSLLGGMLGMASGVFLVPALALFGGIPLHHAVGASLVSVIACSCGSAAPFLRNGLTNTRLALLLETATTLGALSGVLLVGIIPEAFLYFLFAVIMLLSAQQMLARRGDPAADPEGKSHPWSTALGLDGSCPDPVSGAVLPYRPQRVGLGMALMYFAGVISALLGIGSGVLKIPVMDTALRLPIKVSSATSNFMIGVTAAAGAGAYFARGEIVPGIAGPVALGSVIGAVLGARILMAGSNERLRLLFVVVLLGLAVQMFCTAFGVPLFGKGV